jgi:hypothetical protein
MDGCDGGPVTEFLEPGSAGELARFAELQARLPGLFRSARADALLPRTIVVVPGLSLDPEQLARISGTLHYEERHLSMLLHLRVPNTRIVYLTSQALDPRIVDYYLTLLPGGARADARRRLVLMSPDDGSLDSLTAKILERPVLLERLRKEVGDSPNAYLSVFNSSPLERTLAVRLGIPLNACDPTLVTLGGKSGSRSVFRAAGIRFPDGAEDLRDAADLAEALTALKLRRPELRRAVVKLNEGFSGEGNATFAFGGAPTGDTSALRSWIGNRLPCGLRYEARGERWEHYCSKLGEVRGIVEECVQGAGKHSPSTQLRINALGEIELISTHDQVLGGRSGQTFLGSSFPASTDYRDQIQEAGLRVAEELRQRGVIGRFAVDFVVTRVRGACVSYAIEINLRKGGTTFPFEMLQMLTDGRYDPNEGLFRTRSGEARYYYASDNLQKGRYRSLAPDDVLLATAERGLRYEASSQQGATFSMLGCLQKHGKLGITAIGDSPDRSARLYGEIVEALDETAA